MRASPRVWTPDIARDVGSKLGYSGVGDKIAGRVSALRALQVGATKNGGLAAHRPNREQLIFIRIGMALSIE